MANPTMVLIASHTTGSGGDSSYTFSSIPQTYTDLKLVVSSRGTLDDGQNGQVIILYPNGNSTNSTNKYLLGIGSSVYTGNTTNIFNYMTASNFTANSFGNTEFYIPNYTSSNYKSISSDGTGEANTSSIYLAITANLWSSSSAITSLQIVTGGASGFAQYSTFYLYGINNS